MSGAGYTDLLHHLANVIPTSSPRSFPSGPPHPDGKGRHVGCFWLLSCSFLSFTQVLALQVWFVMAVPSFLGLDEPTVKKDEIQLLGRPCVLGCIFGFFVFFFFFLFSSCACFFQFSNHSWFLDPKFLFQMCPPLPPAPENRDIQIHQEKSCS